MGLQRTSRPPNAWTEDYVDWLSDQAQERQRAAEMLARTVRETRRRLRVTQAELAARIGSTQPSLSRLERGRLTDVGIQMVQRIGSALGMETVVAFQKRH